MIPSLHAETQLAAIEAASAPYMRDSDYRSVVGRYQRDLGATTKPKKATASDLAAIGIRVKEVKRG